MTFKEASVESVADAYLELLSARGVEYFFGNGGTDFGPIAEVYVKRSASEQPVPKPITVPHEITGSAMALGYAMISGRPQVVMVHTVPGTANALGTIITASRSNISNGYGPDSAAEVAARLSVPSRPLVKVL